MSNDSMEFHGSLVKAIASGLVSLLAVLFLIGIGIAAFSGMVGLRTLVVVAVLPVLAFSAVAGAWVISVTIVRCARQIILALARPQAAVMVVPAVGDAALVQPIAVPLPPQVTIPEILANFKLVRDPKINDLFRQHCREEFEKADVDVTETGTSSGCLVSVANAKNFIGKPEVCGTFSEYLASLYQKFKSVGGVILDCQHMAEECHQVIGKIIGDFSERVRVLVDDMAAFNKLILINLRSLDANLEFHLAYLGLMQYCQPIDATGHLMKKRIPPAPSPTPAWTPDPGH